MDICRYSYRYTYPFQSDDAFVIGSSVFGLWAATTESQQWNTETVLYRQQQWVVESQKTSWLLRTETTYPSFPFPHQPPAHLRSSPSCAPGLIKLSSSVLLQPLRIFLSSLLPSHLA